MPRELPVTQVMTRDVLTVSTEEPVEEVVRMLAERGVSGVPVIDDHGRLVGLLDDTDLLIADARLHAPTVIELFGAYVTLPGERRRYEDELRHALASTAAGLMQAPAFVREDATVEDVATVMVERRVSRVAVVDDDQRVIGIVTRGDLVAAMGR